MHIKKVNCEQFGGIQNKSLEFSDGLNILCGDNETGKSTIVDLMYYLLFRELDARANSDFQASYFPKKSDGISGKFVEGDIVFETKSGLYTLKKTWRSPSGTCKLTLPDGRQIDDFCDVDRIVSDELLYGKGIFDEVVFSSQKRDMTLMQGLFLSGKKLTKEETKKSEVKREISSMVTKAVLETGGVSLSKLEQLLSNNLKKYNERWDFDADMPEGGNQKHGIENKWACATTKEANKGKQAIILRAYYDREEIDKKRREAKKAEDVVRKVNQRLKDAKEKKQRADERRERFQMYRGVLKNCEPIRKSIETNEELRDNMIGDKKKWPEVTEKYERSKKLKADLDAAACRDLYEKIKKDKDSVEKKQREISQLGNVEDTDISKVIELERSIDNLSGQLRGLNISAKIRQLGSIVPEVHSAETGAKIEILDGTFSIKEAVEILIPGIMELQLMPVGVDIDTIKNELSEKREEREKILHEYSVNSVNDLQKKKSDIISVSDEIRSLNQSIEIKLGERSWESLQKENESLPNEVRMVSEINEEISELCEGLSIEVYMGRQLGVISDLERDYSTMEELDRRIDEKEQDLKKFQEDIKVLETIPEEYRGIDNPDEYDERLKRAVKDCEDEIEGIRGELSEKERQLGEQTAEEYSELLKEAQEHFEDQKAVYAHWKHIDETVRQVKETSLSHPMKDIEDKFREYLSLLSDGTIVLNDFSDDMDSSISSGSNQLLYNNLSEGTKDTIALAFRLSVLEHLYPDGDGLAVFDDPFTDMDPDRTEQACRLIQKFAEKNQVIFVTCDPKYNNFMRGTPIEFK